MNEYGREIIERDRRREIWLHGTIKRGAALVKAVRWCMGVEWRCAGSWAMLIALFMLLMFCPMILGS